MQKVIFGLYFCSMNVPDILNNKTLDELLDEARNLYDKSENEKSENVAKYVLERATAENNILKQAQAYLTIGTTYFNRSIYEKALENYHTAEKLLSELQNEKELIPCQVNIGIVQTSIGNFEKALQAYNKALHILGNADNSMQHAQLYNSIGNVLSKKNEPLQALSYFEKVTTISHALDIAYGIAMGYKNEAACHVELSNFEMAISKAEYSAEISRKNSFEGLRIDALQTLAEACIAINNYDKALHILETETSSLIKLNNDYSLREHYRLLYMAARKVEKFNEALSYHEKYFQVNEKMLSAERHKALNALQIQFETEKNEAAIRELELKNKIIQQEKNSYALEALKSRMNPHFIFNVMDSVQTLMYKGDKEKAIIAVQQFAGLMRASLEHSGTEYISVDEEVEMLTHYIATENIITNNEINFEVNVGDSIDVYNTMIPSLLLQPLVENSIKHGLRHKHGHKQLSVMFTLANENTLSVVIEDNGVGRDYVNNNRAIKHKSYATTAIAKRIALLNENKTQCITINYIDKKDEAGNATGTTVEVNLPLNVDL